MFDIPYATYAEWHTPEDENKPRTDLDQHTITVNVPIIVSFTMNADMADNQGRGLELFQAAHNLIRETRANSKPETHGAISVQTHAPFDVYKPYSKEDDAAIIKEGDGVIQLPFISIAIANETAVPGATTELCQQAESLRRVMNTLNREYGGLFKMIDDAEDEYKYFKFVQHIGKKKGFIFFERNIDRRETLYYAESIEDFMKERGIESREDLHEEWFVLMFNNRHQFQIIAIQTEEE